MMMIMMMMQVSVVILSHGRQRLGEDEVMGVNGEGLRLSDVSMGVED